MSLYSSSRAGNSGQGGWAMESMPAPARAAVLRHRGGHFSVEHVTARAPGAGADADGRTTVKPILRMGSSLKG
jgi:hypothetical protein